MTTPDYIVIGAMKCGTTTLAAQLGAQSGLFMTTPKEPNYFSDDDVFARGPDWYSALFDAAAPGGQHERRRVADGAHGVVGDEPAGAIDPASEGRRDAIVQQVQVVCSGTMAANTPPPLPKKGRI